jgi:hypothetical protein
MDDERKLKEFNEQHDKEYSSPPLNLRNQGTPGQSPQGLSPEDQKIMNELQTKMQAANPNLNFNAPPNVAPISTPPPTVNIQTMGNVCPECGVMHPPVPMGQRCPNAKVNLEKISDAEIGQFIGSWKNIIVSQIEKRNFKNPKKVFQQATLMLTKLLEEYEEKEEVNVEPNPTEGKEKDTH